MGEPSFRNFCIGILYILFVSILILCFLFIVAPWIEGLGDISARKACEYLGGSRCSLRY